MTSKIGIGDEKLPDNRLPPIININPREKIDYDKVSNNCIKQLSKLKHSQNTHSLYRSHQKSIEAHPLYPLSITWSPNNLCLEIFRKEIISELWLWNSCCRTVYIRCCGLWDADDKARLGASWRCYPRTRFRIAPGLISKLFIKAKPRAHSPVPSAIAGLQLAAAHMRDHVTGFFVVPIRVKFLNHVPPCLGECE